LTTGRYTSVKNPTRICSIKGAPAKMLLSAFAEVSMAVLYCPGQTSCRLGSPAYRIA
jgi:hypothetical protein